MDSVSIEREIMRNVCMRGPRSGRNRFPALLILLLTGLWYWRPNPAFPFVPDVMHVPVPGRRLQWPRHHHALAVIMLTSRLTAVS